MAFIPVPNTAYVELRYSALGQNCQNGLYFTYTSNPTVAELQTLAAFVVDWWDTNVKPYVSSSLSLQSLQVTDLTSRIDTGFTFSSGLPLTGTLVNDMYATNCALSLKLSTALRGRSYQGRLFLLGFTESQVVNNRVDGTWRGNMKTAFDTLLANAFGDTGAVWSVVSRYANNAPRATGISTPIINVGFVDDVVDSQRRRLPGRGA